MSRSDRDKIEAEREARRAKRLSDRAEQRARRKAEQAQRAAERAEELAARAKRRSPRHRNRERSIEDVVDDVAEKWSRKAEDWIEDQSRKMFDSKEWSDMSGMGSSNDMGMGDSSDYWGTGASTDDDYASEDDYGEDDYGNERRRRRSDSNRRAKRRERIKKRKARLKEEFGLARERRRFKRRNRNGNLYRNTQNKKIFGVCSGIADYWGMEAWQVRFMAVFGIFVIPSIVVPGYFICSFMMDDKPYYRKVTDRFHELDDEPVKPAMNRKRTSRSERTPQEPKEPNPQVLKQAKRKFADIEDRLRIMESHVTSPKFELHRELRKISGDDV